MLDTPSMKGLGATVLACVSPRGRACREPVVHQEAADIDGEQHAKRCTESERREASAGLCRNADIDTKRCEHETDPNEKTPKVAARPQTLWSHS